MRTGRSTISGATQTPLLRADQLVPGVFITGAAASNVWEIVGRRGDDIELSLVKAAPNTFCAEHNLRPRPTGTLRTCTCGYALEAAASLLPLREDTPRVTLLVPSGRVIVPDRYTVYVGANQTILTVLGDGNWDEATVPVIPKLYPVWTVPDELRETIRESVEGLARGATPRAAR